MHKERVGNLIRRWRRQGGTTESNMGSLVDLRLTFKCVLGRLTSKYVWNSCMGITMMRGRMVKLDSKAV